jgi:hypothetical protein
LRYVRYSAEFEKIDDITTYDNHSQKPTASELAAK